MSRRRTARSTPRLDAGFFPHDGRNLAPSHADLAGEAVGLRIDPAMDTAPVPTVVETAVIKPPRWTWEVPAYLALGGIAGASATLGLAVHAVNGRPARSFARATRLVSGVTAATGGALLVADLGRPERFYNMMRVFRPSSPMNMGSWILAGQAGSTWVSLGSSLLPGRLMAVVSGATGVTSGLLGMPLAGYTGVLLGSTANPAWHEVRRELPPLFVASATSAGSGVATLFPADRRFRRAAELFGIAGRAADLAMSWRVRRRLRPFPATTAAWEHGKAGTLDRAANAGTAGALVLGALGLRWSWARRLGAVTAVGASFAQRFAVFEAAKAAAADPETTYETQRSVTSGPVTPDSHRTDDPAR